MPAGGCTKPTSRKCNSHCVPFDWLSFGGDPIATLQLASEIRDLVITGHDTSFYGNIHEQLSETVAQLLLTTPRPVIVCGDEAVAGRDILIAYDGSVPAMRAVQILCCSVSKGSSACI